MTTTTDRRKSNTFYVILIAGAAALGGFLFGFDTAVINGAVAAISKAFNANSVETGLAVSLALLGSALGAFYAGKIADRYGRVKAMVVASVLFTISAIGSGLGVGIWDFTFWRLLGGLAVGAASVIAPAYIAECSPTHLRGRLGSLQQLAIVVGIFIALLCDYFIAVSGWFSRVTIFVWNSGLAVDVLDRNSSCGTLRNGSFNDSGIPPLLGCSRTGTRSC